MKARNKRFKKKSTYNQKHMNTISLYRREKKKWPTETQKPKHQAYLNKISIKKKARKAYFYFIFLQNASVYLISVSFAKFFFFQIRNNKQ